MRRRSFIAGAGASAALTRPSLAQQAAPLIGYLTSRPLDAQPHLQAAFRHGLELHGYMEGRNIKIEYRSVGENLGRLTQEVTELVSRRVSLICATGNPAAALAAKRATSTIPVVFTVAANPVELGLVMSLNRPGGNLTGISFLSGELTAKRFELLLEIAPRAMLIAMLANTNNPSNHSQIADFEAAARSHNISFIHLPATTPEAIEPAFASMAARKADALLVGVDPMLTSHREQIVSLATRHALPTCYPLREFAEAGGLMSYGTSLSDAHRLAGSYAGRILKGEHPAELPVQQPTKFELIINLKTAKALGSDVPPLLLARADEVIE